MTEAVFTQLEVAERKVPLDVVIIVHRAPVVGRSVIKYQLKAQIDRQTERKGETWF